MAKPNGYALSSRAEQIATVSRYRLLMMALRGEIATKRVGDRVFFREADLLKLRDERERVRKQA